MIDLNHNGMSDVWEWIYNAQSLTPGGDADGDGASNLMEAMAGTDPFDSNSVPRIPSFTNSATGFSVTFPVTIGKLYQLQSTTSLASNIWLTETSAVVRAGSSLTMTGTNSLVAKFFRVAIADVDTDGDGVNDWEEYQLGLDPLNPNSSGLMNTNNGQLLGDFAYASSLIAQQNVVNIVATDNTALQPDVGQNATSTGSYTITRGGFPMKACTVYLQVPAAGQGFATSEVDYATLPGQITFNAGQTSQTIVLTPYANTNRTAPVVAMLKVAAGAGYAVGPNSNASVVIYPSGTPNGTGLTGMYYTNSSPTYANAANFKAANLKLTRLDPTVDFTWGTTTTPITNSSGYYCVRWQGQVQPQYSETYYFVANTDDGVKLWVNDQLIIDAWYGKGASDLTGTIALQAGVRYDIKMEYYQGTGGAAAHLSWYSPSQSKQIIPSIRLYPTNSTPTPSAVISPLTAVAFLGQPFSYAITGANLPQLYTATGLPPGLTYNSTNGLISGAPNLAGTYQAVLTSSNAYGLGASAVTIQVIDSGSSVVQEIWTGVPGTNVSEIPVLVPATLTNYIGTLEGSTNYGDNYGERVRGYFTAPTTGNYYFWIAGSDSAELWISDDNEQANRMKRAWVLPTLNGNVLGTAPRQWNTQTNQQSGWLSLVAGQSYYIEVLHKAGAGTNDNWSVGYLLDQYGTNTVPGGIVPGYLLSRYFPVPPSIIPGTLYTANLLALPGVSSLASGSATLLVSADGSSAVLRFTVNNIAANNISSEHIDSDPYLLFPAELIFDISDTPPQRDGSYLWYLTPMSPLSSADILEIIREGKASISIHTTMFPGGEIGGHFSLASGSQTFTPPPAPPAWADDHTSSNAASRFLIQSTFGPSPNDIATVRTMGYSNWLQNQFSLPVTHHLPVVLGNPSADPTQPYPSSLLFSTWWKESVTAPDQLRQRVAFALSEIMVVSENGSLSDFYAHCLSSYYDTLLDNAFGNYRTLLEAVSLTPAMGIYLNMQGNDAGSLITGLHANENYAREIMQLFSIGLNRMWPDGTLILNSKGELVPTYTQDNILGFASVFTGWNYYQPNGTNGLLPSNWYPSANYTNPMVLVPTHHELGTKLLLDNVVLPAAQGAAMYSTNAAYGNYGLANFEAAHDSIFNNPNVGPFICRQLIQRLVTSDPNRDYVYRVTQVFENDGTGVRGNLKAVIQAILLDYEARSPVMAGQPGFGKLREPVLRVTAAARAFPAPPTVSGTYVQNGTQTITVTTASNHLMNNNDTAQFSFTDTSGQPAPFNQPYPVTVTSSNSFTINAPYLSSGSYTQTNSIITVTLSSHPFTNGDPVYLNFTTGGAMSGVYNVLSYIDASHFTVSALDVALRSGSFLIPKITGGGFTIVNHTNLTIITPQANGLSAGNNVFLLFNSASSPSNGLYTISSILDATHFQIITTSNVNQTQNGQTTYPLAPPPLSRSGNLTIQRSTWNMNLTDTGSSSSLSQTPLRSPTVFNFFSPGYMFPGQLSAAGLTTPEFQLTSDSAVAEQMNFMEGAVLNNGNNTNGLSSFASGNGSIVLNVSPYLTTNFTANATGVGSLVDSLSTLLVGGQLSSGAKTYIVNYASSPVTFPYSTPPTATQIRDRVLAVVHLILNSPEFTVQR